MYTIFYDLKKISSNFLKVVKIAKKGPCTERVKICINFMIIELTLKNGLIIQ